MDQNGIKLGDFTIAERGGIEQAKKLLGDGHTPFAESLLGKAFAALIARVEVPPLKAWPQGRPPYETFNRPICRGCYALRSACGTCEKCVWERSRMFPVTA